jgi:hypothetical protein
MTKTNKITPDKAARLLALVGDIPDTPARVHLSDEEFADYVVGALPSGEMTRIDRHLAVCDECSHEMEFLIRKTAIWQTPEGKAQLREKEERLLALARKPGRSAGTVLWPDFSLSAAAATGDEVSGEAEIYGHLVRYLIEETGGNLTVTVASHSLALEGRKVLLTAPGFRREITLNRVRKDQVGAETTIERQERVDVEAGGLTLQPLLGE